MASPLTRIDQSLLASHSRAAFSATASSTGWISVGELAMTPKISLVAVCCSNDSLSSLNSRTFSMAITAWSAKVVTSSICRSVNGMTFFRQTENVPIGVPSRSMGTKDSACPIRLAARTIPKVQRLGRERVFAPGMRVRAQYLDLAEAASREGLSLLRRSTLQ